MSGFKSMSELRTVGTRKKKGKGAFKPASSSNRAWRGVGNFFLILLALLLLALIAGGIFASNYLIGVLGELETTDYTQSQQRIAEYEAYFERQSKLGYTVVPSEPFLREGEIYYLWTVTPPHSGNAVVFRWKISLESNTVEALTSSAKNLDREMGFSESEQ